MRRYSKRSKYVIPYNGEEILLHWANNDQYYVKTAENFADYAYKHENWTIRFILKNAVVEEGNIRGAKRFFVPRVREIVLDQQLSALTVPFDFRPLADDETIRYGVKKSSDHSGGYDANKGVTHLKAKGQGAIIKAALASTAENAKSDAGALAAIVHEKGKDDDGAYVLNLRSDIRQAAVWSVRHDCAMVLV